MTFTLSGNVITQSGTDTSLAGLVGISGVTTRTIIQGGPYAPNRVIYVINDRRLRVTGTLTISPRLEALEFGNYKVLPELSIEGGGTLTVQEREGTDPNYVYGNNEWLRVQWTRTNSPPSWEPAGAALANYGTFNWRGGKIVVPNFSQFSGTLNLDYGIIEGVRFQLSGSSYTYIRGGSINISRYVLGTGVFFGAQVVYNTSYSNIESIAFNRGVFATGDGGGSVSNVTTFINPASFEESAFRIGAIRGPRVTAINVPTGSFSSGEAINAFYIQNDAGNASYAQNVRIEVRKRVSFTALTLARTPVQDVHFFTRDTNNGARKNTTRDSYTADRTYLATTDANGVTTLQNVLTAVVYTNSTATISFMPLTLDRRGVGNNSDDIFRWAGWAYSYLPQDLNAQMKGSGDAQLEVTFFDDLSVTLSAAAAAALASIDTLNDFYDAAKNWKCQNDAARLEYPTLFTQPATASGTTLSLGALNVLIDATAAAAFAINTSTNVVTVKSSSLSTGTKFNELSTSGDITFANGATATCRLSGSLSFATPGVVNLSLGTATLTFSTAGTYDLRTASITGTVTLINTSGGAVTVQVQPGVSFVNTGPDITVDNAVNATFTVSGMVVGSRLLIRRTDNQAVLVNEQVTGTSRNYIYTHTADIPVEIVVRKATGSPAYQEWRTTATLTASGGAVVANQVLDE